MSHPLPCPIHTYTQSHFHAALRPGQGSLLWSSCYRGHHRGPCQLHPPPLCRSQGKEPPLDFQTRALGILCPGGQSPLLALPLECGLCLCQSVPPGMGQPRDSCLWELCTEPRVLHVFVAAEGPLLCGMGQDMLRRSTPGCKARGTLVIAFHTELRGVESSERKPDLPGLSKGVFVKVGG